MKKFLIKLLLGDDQKLLREISIEKTSFVKNVDIEKFERDSRDLWSAMGHQFKGLRQWIEDRKALVLRQNLIAKENEGLKAILVEWENVESYITTPVLFAEPEYRADTAPELKTQEQIMDAFKKPNPKA